MMIVGPKRYDSYKEESSPKVTQDEITHNNKIPENTFPSIEGGSSTVTFDASIHRCRDDVRKATLEKEIDRVISERKSESLDEDPLKKDQQEQTENQDNLKPEFTFSMVGDHIGLDFKMIYGMGMSAPPESEMLDGNQISNQPGVITNVEIGNNQVKSSSVLEAESYFTIGERYCNDTTMDHQLRYEKAVESFRQAAHLGHPHSIFKLGELFYQGTIQISAEDGIKFLVEADRLGFKMASFYLGSHFFEKDPRVSFEWFAKAASNGIKEAQCYCGQGYLKGFYVKRDPDEAVKWFKKSYDQGSEKAGFLLGLCYENGWGVTKSKSEAKKFFNKFSNSYLSCAYKIEELGLGFYSGYKHFALSCLDKKIDNLDEYELFYLGCCCRDGKGVEKNVDSAMELFSKSAKRGNCFAQYALGWAFFYGTGVKKDYKEAAKLFKSSSDQGYLPAFFNLSLCYKEGLGVDANLDLYLDIINKLKDHLPEAQLELAKCYLYGIHDVRSDIETAKQWYNQAKKNGYISDENRIYALEPPRDCIIQ